MLLQPGVVGASRLIGVVIREDEKDVGLLSSIRGKSYPSEDEGDEFHDHEPYGTQPHGQALNRPNPSFGKEEK